MAENMLVEFEDLLAGRMDAEGVRAEYQRLEPGFAVARLRMMRGLTQQELAERVGTINRASRDSRAASKSRTFPYCVGWWTP